MEEDEERGDLGRALAVLREALGLDQADVAAAASLPASAVSDYERGHKRPKSRSLERLLAGIEMTPGDLEMALELVRTVKRLPRTDSVVSARLGSATKTLGGAALALWSAPGPNTARKAGHEEPAPALWERLRKHGAAARRAVVQEGETFRSWTLCVLLCETSERAAANSPDQALELAELALWIAGLVPGEESWRYRLQGYAWAFLGNARRVRGDLPEAEAAFARSAELWEAGASAPERPGWLAESRRLDLESSLRRDQRRLPEALALLDRALAHGCKPSRGRVLIKKSKTLEEMHDFAGAVAALREAAPLVAEDADPRLLLCVQFNLLVNLSELGRHAEAAPLLPVVREMTEKLGNGLDLVRLRWLEGKIAAGLGHTGEAEESLRRVRDAFARQGIPYDAALASLELAVLYLRENRTGEVKTLAREMAPVFKAQGVDREALASLRVFCEAAEREEATAELAGRVLASLKRSRVDFSLANRRADEP